jgi:peptidyl-prolyl cis-trans isomerase D
MLQALRSGAKSPLMKFFLLFLAGGFALWGIGDGTTGLIGGSDKAISAGDVSVSPREVAVEFDRTRRAFLPKSSVEEALNSGLLNEVFGAISRDVLIRAETQDLGLTVTRGMQSDAIRNEDRFRDELGKFSEGRFMLTLANAGLSETDYLRRVDTALMREQLIGAIVAGSRFNKASADVVASFDLERRTARLTSFPVLPEKITTPDDVELDVFFTKNKTVYSAPELRSVKIASISAEMVAEGLKISEDDIKTAFEQRVDEFTTPESRDVRQMVFEDLAKANLAMSRLSKGEAFVAVAKDMLNWEDADSLLGTVTKDALDPALAEASFVAEIGKPVGPIESPFGQHVLLVEKITAGGNPELADVRQKIADKLRAEKAISILYDRANQLEDSLGTGATLTEAAAKVGGRVDILEHIDRNGLTIDGVPVSGNIADLVQDSNVLGLIWETGVNEISVIQESNDDLFFVVEVTSQTPQRERSLEEVRARVIADWKTVEAIKKAREQADATAARNSDDGDLTEPFRRNGTGLDHQAAGLIARAAFGQNTGTSSVIETGSEAIVVKTSEIMAPKLEEIDATSQYVREVMGSAMREDMLNMVLISLSAKHGLQMNTASVRQLLIGSQ